MAKMSPLPESSYSPVFPGDNRMTLPYTGGERELLTSFLDYYRGTIELKCLGVPKERLAERSMPPSTMSLQGLVRHLAGTEQWWFQYQFAQEEVEHLFGLDNLEADFEDLSGDFDDDLATWRAMCERSREIVARTESLDTTGIRERTGEPVSLRRIMLHMIAEYARHSGHADLLREGIDGAVGT